VAEPETRGARRLHEEREGRAPVDLGDVDDVEREVLVGQRVLVGHLVDLGRHDPFVRGDLAVLAVERDPDPSPVIYHVAPRAADPQIDLDAGHPASAAGPPALDQLGRGPRPMHQVLGSVELPRDEDLVNRRAASPSPSRYSPPSRPPA
jgi:hypothetical protein